MSRLVIGLTGGVASGKSAVGDYFEKLGAPVLDADQVSRDIVAPPSPALAEIAEQFGPESLLSDGSLDRRRMRERVFSDPVAKNKLESILHPHIAHRMAEWRDAQTFPYCILSVAILLETRMRQLVARVLVVDVSVEAQLARVMARDGINQSLAQSMIAAQTSREKRLSAADDVIHNHGSLEDTHRQIDKLHQRYLELARA